MVTSIDAKKPNTLSQETVPITLLKQHLKLILYSLPCKMRYVNLIKQLTYLNKAKFETNAHNYCLKESNTLIQ